MKTAKEIRDALITCGDEIIRQQKRLFTGCRGYTDASQRLTELRAEQRALRWVLATEEPEPAEDTEPRAVRRRGRKT